MARERRRNTRARVSDVWQGVRSGTSASSAPRVAFAGRTTIIPTPASKQEGTPDSNHTTVGRKTYDQVVKEFKQGTSNVGFDSHAYVKGAYKDAGLYCSDLMADSVVKHAMKSEPGSNRASVTPAAVQRSTEDAIRLTQDLRHIVSDPANMISAIMNPYSGSAADALGTLVSNTAYGKAGQVFKLLYDLSQVYNADYGWRFYLESALKG